MIFYANNPAFISVRFPRSVLQLLLSLYSFTVFLLYLPGIFCIDTVLFLQNISESKYMILISGTLLVVVRFRCRLF